MVRNSGLARRVGRRQTWAAAGILLALLCGLFWEAIFTDRVMSQADYLRTKAPWSAATADGETFVPQNSLLRDQSYQFIPWRKFAVDAIRGGTLPLWNPYAYCGAPFVANDQSAVFYPLTLLYLALPFHVATLVAAVLRLLVAGLGMYWLMRRFEVSFGPALVSSVAFMLCGSLIVWLNHPHTNVTVLLPLLLLLVDRLFDPGGVRAGGLLALVVGVQFLGGHVESSLILAVAAGTFLAYRVVEQSRRTGTWETSRGPLASAVVAVILGLLIGAVQLLPLAEYLRNSRVVATRGSKAGIERESSRGIWWRAAPAIAMPRLYGDPVDSEIALPTAFKPELGLRNYNERNGAYVGAPMLLLGLVGCTLIGRRRYAAYFAGLGLLAFCLAYRIPPVHSLFLLLPGMELTAMMLVRMQLLVALATCALGAFALEQSMRGFPSDRSRAHRLVLLAGLAGSAIACVWSVGFFLADRPTFDRTWQLLRDARLLPPDAARQAAAGFALSGIVLLVSVAIAALLVWRGRRLLGHRVWIGWGLVVVVDLFVFAYGYNPIVSPDDVFPDTPTVEFLRDNLGHGRIAARNALPASTTTWYGFRDVHGYDAIEVHDYALVLRARGGMPPGLMRALGVRYFVVDPRSPPAPGRVVHDGDARIYEVPEPISRVNLVGRAVDVGALEPHEVLAALRDPRFDPTEVVLLDPPVTGSGGGPGFAEIARDGVNEVVVDARAPQGGWLVLSDTYFPGWRVEVDGRPAELLRANLVFRAVRLGPGNHEVRFHYRPLSFVAGAWLSFVGWVGAGALLVGGKKRRSVDLRPARTVTRRDGRLPTRNRDTTAD